MKSSFVGFACAVIMCCGICACGRAPQVNDTADSKVPTAPPLETADATGAQDADAPAEFTTTPSGLKYRILRKGTGPKPTRSSTAVVNYKGWLTDPNDPFDQSYGREPFPVDMSGGVIDGWLEGLTYVEEGGMIELEIPSQLGYAERGTPDGTIPPNSTLHFTVEVLEVK